MDQGNGTPATYIECIEFFIAPTEWWRADPDPPTPPSLLTTLGLSGQRGLFGGQVEADREAQAAAGIMVEVSAGNAGSACSTCQTHPSIYAASFSIGALNRH